MSNTEQAEARLHKFAKGPESTVEEHDDVMTVLCALMRARDRVTVLEAANAKLEDGLKEIAGRAYAILQSANPGAKP